MVNAERELKTSFLRDPAEKEGDDMFRIIIKYMALPVFTTTSAVRLLTGQKNGSMR